jgi:hypothetical protein
MTQTFNSVLAPDIGTADKVLLSIPDKKSILVGGNFSNKTPYELPITVWIRRNAADVVLVKNLRIGSGQNTDIVKGKLILEAGDQLMARTVMDLAFDALLAVLTGID